MGKYRSRDNLQKDVENLEGILETIYDISQDEELSDSEALDQIAQISADAAQIETDSDEDE